MTEELSTHIYIYGLIYTQIFLCFVAEMPTRNGTLLEKGTECPDLGFYIIF